MVKRIAIAEINRIQVLRSKGYSLPEIKKVTSISYGSIFRYIRGIKINPEFDTLWRGKRGGSTKRKLIAEKKALEKANQIGLSLTEKEKILILAALYWGEGSKKDFGLSNSDPELIRVFVDGLVNALHISLDRIRVSVRIYEDLDRDACLAFWSSITNKSAKEMHIDILHGRKTGKLPYGMCRVRLLKGGNELKYLKAVYKIISNQMSL